MDRIGLLSRIFESTSNIDNGRKGLDTEGFEGEGRISYRAGLDMGIKAFKDAQSLASSDLATLIISEATFLTRELEFCDPSDKQTANSLKQAIQSFDDALLALQAVENADMYHAADLTYPHSGKHRIKDMPKDSFHIACLAHRTRIGNMLRTPGINMSEKEMLEQRRSNLATAQSEYLKRQRRALN